MLVVHELSGRRYSKIDDPRRDPVPVNDVIAERFGQWAPRLSAVQVVLVCNVGLMLAIRYQQRLFGARVAALNRGPDSHYRRTDPREPPGRDVTAGDAAILRALPPDAPLTRRGAVRRMRAATWCARRVYPRTLTVQLQVRGCRPL
jgi:hypothetical protein